MKQTMGARRRTATAAALGLGLILAAGVASAADYTIIDANAGGDEGLDASRAAMPVGGNTGTTLGEQRRIALNRAVRIIMSRVASPVPIRIRVDFEDAVSSDLPCQRDSATLALGGPSQYVLGSSFAAAPDSNLLYPLALANALAGQRLADRADIELMFNGWLDTGGTSCLRGTTWYYGLDGEAGDNQIDFIATAVHEIIHGLGFQSLVALSDRSDASAGQFPELGDGRRHADVFSAHIQDLSLPGQPLWTTLDDDQRADSLDNGPDVVWASATTSSAAAGYLDAGLTQGRVQIYAPSPVVDGSSISHWAIDVSPDQLMEPYETLDTSADNGIGLASCALETLGWQLIGGTRCPDINSAAIADDAVQQVGPTVMNAEPQTETDNNQDGGGGGGCTLTPGSRFDPLWGGMLVLAAGVLVWRRRRGHHG